MAQGKGLPETITLGDLETAIGHGDEPLFRRTIGEGNQGYYLRTNVVINGTPSLVMLTVTDKPSRK